MEVYFFTEFFETLFEKVSTFLQNSPLIEKMIINISLNDGAETDPDLLADAAGEFSAILKERYQPEYIKTINDTVSQEKMAVIYSVFYNNIPLFLTDDDYKDIDRIVKSETGINISYGKIMRLTLCLVISSRRTRVPVRLLW